MDGFDLTSYNELQLREIRRHKWIESEKVGRDLGQEAVRDWIQRYAGAFREAWMDLRRRGSELGR